MNDEARAALTAAERAYFKEKTLRGVSSLNDTALYVEKLSQAALKLAKERGREEVTHGDVVEARKGVV